MKAVLPPVAVEAGANLLRRRADRNRFAGLEPFSLRYMLKRESTVDASVARVAAGSALDGAGVLDVPDLAHADERVVEYPWAMAALHDRRGGRLLDVGCVLNTKGCAAPLEEWFDERWFLNLVSEPLYGSGHTSMVAHDIREPLFLDRWFDVVTCISTLEHIGMDNRVYTGESGARDPAGAENALREMTRIVRPGGKVLVTVPVGAPVDDDWFRVFTPAELDSIVASVDADVSFEWFAPRAGGWTRVAAADVTGLRYGDGRPGAAAIACISLTPRPR